MTAYNVRDLLVSTSKIQTGVLELLELWVENSKYILKWSYINTDTCSYSCVFVQLTFVTLVLQVRVETSGLFQLKTWLL